jgi:erythromycin esterase-like protein
MISLNPLSLSERLRSLIRPINQVDDLIHPILELVGDARIVLIGEASHGTEDFYEMRARITERLITDAGFTAVCAEADWPDAWRVNRFVRGFTDDTNAAEALAGFKRFPQWMWRNTIVLAFVNWLREHNDSIERSKEKAGFYGIDLYSMYQSIQAVVEYLDTVDHAAAGRARFRYACFDHFGEDPQAYGYAAGFNLDQTCEREVVAQLKDLRAKAGEYSKRDGRVAEDEYFYAEQNARLIANAERYYRTMFEGSVPSWNLRDEHMADTIDALLAYLDRVVARGTRIVVWAHNSHLGDAGATEMSQRGEWNVGQLVRRRWGDRARNIGFSTFTGTVTAATDWNGPAETKRVHPGLNGSWEQLFHDVAAAAHAPRFLLRPCDASGELLEALRRPRLQRAIGVIYRPQTERLSHYFDARVADQFDAMIHLDETRALVPLDRRPIPEAAALEETYPTGL